MVTGAVCNGQGGSRDLLRLKNKQTKNLPDYPSPALHPGQFLVTGSGDNSDGGKCGLQDRLYQELCNIKQMNGYSRSHKANAEEDSLWLANHTG